MNKRYRSTQAFTLIELMVVVAVIGIMIGGMFRLIGAAGEKKKEAETVARLQKVQNALSGFYAEYGSYPPVALQTSPDPYKKVEDNGAESSAPTLDSDNANRAAAAQPISFARPNVQSLNEYINLIYQPQGILNVNEALGGSAANRTNSGWQHGTRIFQFGVLSYLLPRVGLLGGKDLYEGGDTPDMNFFKGKQWTENNTGTIKAISDREKRVISRWLPNFEGIVKGMTDLWGIHLGMPRQDGYNLRTVQDPETGVRYVLLTATIVDGWDHDLYYYSAPPYQSYRLWSSGPDGKTFPPWASPKDADRATAASWTKDDIVRFDR